VDPGPSHGVNIPRDEHNDRAVTTSTLYIVSRASIVMQAKKQTRSGQNSSDLPFYWSYRLILQQRATNITFR
jgi:hypothetical protein